MAYGNESPGTMPDKKLLDTCVTAFEIAIREIRKIENGENAENVNEPVVLDKSVLNAMSNELVNYCGELYALGFKNGRENLCRAKDTIADEIKLSITDIIKKAVYPDSRKQRGGAHG